MNEFLVLSIYCTCLVLISYISINLFISVAPKLGFVDIPNERSSHKKITPRGAGIVFGFLYIIFLIVYNIDNFIDMYIIYVAILIVYLTGVIDDKVEIKSRTKFLSLIIASVLAYYGGFGIESLGTYFYTEITLGYLALPFTVFAIVGLTNAVNLSDGLDGLAGSISVMILACLLYVGIIYDDNFLISWSSILIAVVLGFLILNWYPAKVFMGDSGSLLLGFIISVLAIRAVDYINHAAVLFLAAVPILDTLIVFRRRIQRGISPFIADQNHLHHVLNNIKHDKAYTVKMLIMIQFVFSCMFIQLYNKSNSLNILIFLTLFIIFYGLFDPRMKRRNKNARLRKKHQKN